MEAFGCRCNNACTSIAIVASLIIGVVTAFVRIMAVITITSAFLWVTFGIAVVYLAILLASVFFSERTAQRCVAKTVNTVLIGILGTVLFSAVLLAIPFAATSIIGAIINGALLFFFSLIITTTACLVEQLL